jgi:putative tryptophan/tyrosine transport system substrate-binding protein
MAIHIRRRELIVMVGGAAAAWPLAARAQQPDKVRLVGMLMGFAEKDPVARSMVATFRSTLSKLGWTEGGNVRTELRWAGSDPDRINTLANELAGLRPDAILGQTTPVVKALAREMPTSPIVFVTVSDPIGSGFTANFARPGGNITGFTVDDSAVGGKWVELLKQIAPAIARVTLLFNPAGPPLQFFMPSIQTAASSFNIQVNVATIHAKDEIESVIAGQARDPGGSLIVMPNAFNTTNRDLIIELTARYRVPAIYFSTYGAQSGGLMSYGSDYAEQSRQAAGYIDRILKGTKPADLPVQAPTKFEFVINLKTAKELGLNVPPTLLAIADEVIE